MLKELLGMWTTLSQFGILIDALCNSWEYWPLVPLISLKIR